MNVNEEDFDLGFKTVPKQVGQIRIKASSGTRLFVWINLHQNYGNRKVFRSKAEAFDSASPVKHGRGSIGHGHVWLPVGLGHWCSFMM